MSSSVLTAVGVFVGGITVGATGALLLGPRDARQAAPPPRTAVLPHAPTQAAPLAALADERLIGGHPGPVADFLRHAAYVSAYDRIHRHAHWTAEHITAASIASAPRTSAGDDGGEVKRVDRSRSVFQEDARVPPLFRARNADYFRSGYDRGHMVPAADAKQSQQAMDETFFLSNMAPQVGEGFNRDYWAHTEDFVRRLTQKFADVYVFTVPLYLPRQAADGKWRVSYEVIGDPPNVSVPTHFAKVIYASGRPGGATSTATAPAPLALPGPDSSSAGGGGGLLSRVGLRGSDFTAIGAFVMPNAIIPNEVSLRSFAVPIESVERAAGLLLFPPAVRTNTRALCDVVECAILVRDFSNRNKNNNSKRGVAIGPGTTGA